MPWDECRLQVGQWIHGRLRKVQCMNAGAMEVISQYEWTNTSQLPHTLIDLDMPQCIVKATGGCYNIRLWL